MTQSYLAVAVSKLNRYDDFGRGPKMSVVP